MGAKKLAIQTQLWGNGNLEQDFRPIFEEVIQAGYDGVECRFTVLRHKEELQRYLQSNSLTIHALHTSPDLFYSDHGVKKEFHVLLSDMKEFGVTKLLISPSRKKSFEEQADSLSIAGALAEICNLSGIQLYYHNHAFEFDYGFRLYDEIIRIPHLSIALDIGWLFRAGVALQDFMAKYKEHIGYYHIKDTTMDEWRELGTGDVNIAQALSLLESVPMDWWTVEQDNSTLLSLESAKRSRSYLNVLGY